MRRIPFLIMMLFAGLNAMSQNALFWKQRGVSIHVNSQFDLLESTLDDYEVENENMAVVMECVPVAEESPEFLSDFKYGLIELAYDSGVELQGEPIELQSLPFGYYSVFQSKMDEHQGFVFVFQSNDKRFIYEGFLDCYNGDMQACEDVLQGISLE